ncbi:MAG: hypothetical protein ACR2RL_19640, partial [Gammaproteobacteria bacterium]
MSAALARGAMGARAMALPIAALILSPCAMAQQPPVEQKVERDDVTLVMSLTTAELAWSELLELTLTLQTSGERLATMPRIDERLGDFRVVARAPDDPELQVEGPRQWVRRYSLEPVRAGELEIPALAFEAEDASVKPSVSCRYLQRCPKKKLAALATVRLETAPQPVLVTSLLGESPDVYAPRDIAPPRPLPGAARSGGLAWLLAAVLAGVLVLAFNALRKRRAVAPLSATETARVDGGRAAIDAIDALLAGQHFDAERIRLSYEQLSTVLRDFIGWRFGFATRPRTSEETLLALHAEEDKLHRDAAGRLLRACDHVKFAGSSPGPGALRAELEQARRFVDEAMT